MPSKCPFHSLGNGGSEKRSSVPAMANNQRCLIQTHGLSSLFQRLRVALSCTFLLCTSGPAYPVWNSLPSTQERSFLLASTMLARSVALRLLASVMSSAGILRPSQGASVCSQESCDVVSGLYPILLSLSQSTHLNTSTDIHPSTCTVICPSIRLSSHKPRLLGSFPRQEASLFP